MWFFTIIFSSSISTKTYTKPGRARDFSTFTIFNRFYVIENSKDLWNFPNVDRKLLITNLVGQWKLFLATILTCPPKHTRIIFIRRAFFVVLSFWNSFTFSVQTFFLGNFEEFLVVFSCQISCTFSRFALFKGLLGLFPRLRWASIWSWLFKIFNSKAVEFCLAITNVL